MADPAHVARSAVSVALAAGDRAGLRDALADNDVVVLYAEAEGAKRPVILTAPDGGRCVAAFTSQDAVDAFTDSALVGVVPGSELAALALRQGVDAVLIDPAGPAPASIPPQALQDLVDGLDRASDGGTLLTGDQVFAPPVETDQLTAVRQAVRALVPAGHDAFLVDRVAGEHRVLTLAVHGSADTVRQVADSLTGLVDVDLDVMRLDDAIRDALATQAPQCRVQGR